MYPDLFFVVRDTQGGVKIKNNFAWLVEIEAIQVIEYFVIGGLFQQVSDKFLDRILIVIRNRAEIMILGGIWNEYLLDILFGCCDMEVKWIIYFLKRG